MSGKPILLVAGLTLVLVASHASAQVPARLGAERKPLATVNLYPGVAPGSEDWKQVERVTTNPANGNRIIFNVVTPTLEVYLPDRDKATGVGVIIAPGGAMRLLSYDSEGVWVAQWLAARGIAGFVLKYRVNETPADGGRMGGPPPAGAGRNPPARPTPPAGGAPPAGAARPAGGPRPLAGSGPGIADGVRAVQLVRERATEWGVDPQRVGLMGFSAGALVTMGAVSKGARPSFAAPIYGGTWGDPELPLPAELPPIFIAVAGDDNLASPGALQLYQELQGRGAKPELHIYHTGGHGFGLEPRNNSSAHWIDEFYWWLESNGWLKSSAGS